MKSSSKSIHFRLILSTISVYWLAVLLLTACGQENVAVLPTATSSPAATVTSKPLPTGTSTSTPSPVTGTEAPKPQPTFAGWAINAYPDMSKEQMLAAVKRMKESGANIIWISHANPAHSYAQEREVGLNPAVWFSYTDFASPTFNDAVEIVKAQKRLLDACRELQVKVVLSVGYHTQMGQVWSTKNSQHLRRRANGEEWHPVTGTLPYGSIYSPVFQQDLWEYYRWLEFEFISPYSDILQMINLADEPLGGDYSSWAEAEFNRRTGFNFRQVGTDPARQQKLGEFQAGMIADFMKLAAGSWLKLKPGLKVTMSFDGGIMRLDDGMPNLEQLFAQAPANFVLTWDMYPRDRGNLAVAVSEDDITRLIYLTRLIAGYSAQYDKKVWFWSAANSWGLGQPPTDPAGTISDAIANLLMLTMLMNQGGGKLEGMAVWNYNVKTQGLYNFAVGMPQNKATWNEDEMFSRVSGFFEEVRQLMQSAGASAPQVIILRSPGWQHLAIGANRADTLAATTDWAKADMLVRSNVNFVETGYITSAIPANWKKKTLMVLSPAEFLSEPDKAGLRNWLNEGGTVVASLGVVQAFTNQNSGNWNGAPQLVNYAKGKIYASREPISTLFDSSREKELGNWWQEAFAFTMVNAGYVINAGNLYLQYHLGKSPVKLVLPSNYRSVAYYRANGVFEAIGNPGSGGIVPNSNMLSRSEFILARR